MKYGQIEEVKVASRVTVASDHQQRESIRLLERASENINQSINDQKGNGGLLPLHASLAISSKDNAIKDTTKIRHAWSLFTATTIYYLFVVYVKCKYKNALRAVVATCVANKPIHVVVIVLHVVVIVLLIMAINYVLLLRSI